MMTDITSSKTAFPSLQRKFEGRALRSLVLTTLVWAGALLAVVVIINLIISHGGMAQTHSSKVKEALETGGAAKILRDAGAPEVPGASKIPGLPQGN